MKKKAVKAKENVEVKPEGKTRREIVKEMHEPTLSSAMQKELYAL